MAAAETAMFTAAITVGIAGALGYGLYYVITVKGDAKSASDFGRKWLAWMVLIATVTVLPSFFQHLDANSFARWVIAVVAYGAISFAAGWTYGRFFGVKKNQNK